MFDGIRQCEVLALMNDPTLCGRQSEELGAGNWILPTIRRSSNNLSGFQLHVSPAARVAEREGVV